MPDATHVQPMALEALLDRVRTRLRAGAIPDAGREARHLIGALVGVAPEIFLGHPETPVSGPDCARVMAALGQRLAGIPVSRIVGRRSFYGRSYRLGPAILDPRPDSEVVIDAALEIITAGCDRQRPVRIIDVGTGSGCLLITLLAELPFASGVGVDIEADALNVARQNARDHGVADRAAFLEGDLLRGIDREFDVLVSNPPYICTGELAGLDIEVRAHDPVRALDGGPDGLDIYRRIGRDVGRVVPSGWMLFEVGAGIAEAVCHEIDQFAVDNQLRDWRVWPDLHGHTRCVAAKTLNG